jgi:hypothetical protein
MLQDGGYDVILKVCEEFGKVAREHIIEYGDGNEKRLTGKHEACDINTFKYGVANRGASIRIPRDAEKDGKGYMEDRRPAANCDPYRVTNRMMKTTGPCLSKGSSQDHDLKSMMSMMENLRVDMAKNQEESKLMLKQMLAQSNGQGAPGAGLTSALPPRASEGIVYTTSPKAAAPSLSAVPSPVPTMLASSVRPATVNAVQPNVAKTRSGPLTAATRVVPTRSLQVNYDRRA